MKNILIAFIIIIPYITFAQNTFLTDGSNGSGIEGDYATGSDGFSLISGNAAFSIGGILDIGMGFGSIESKRYDQDATDTTFGLVYNIKPIQYNVSIVNLIANIRGTYDYILVDSDYVSSLVDYASSNSDYVNSIDETMEGQGFSIAIEALLDITPIDFITIRGGYHAKYDSYVYSTLATDEGNVIEITDRERNTETGFIAGLWLNIPNVPIIGYEMLFLDSSKYSEYFKHRISIVIKSK